MDLYIHRNNNDLHLGVHRKSTQTGTTIHFTSKHPLEHILAAHSFYINRMITLPITKQVKQQEWNIILTMSTNNGFPLKIIHKLKKKIIFTKQKSNPHKHNKRKKWVTFTYYSPLIHKVANLFKNTNLKIAFRTNNIHNKLCDRIALNKINPSGIYKLKCKTCNNSYVGQIYRNTTSSTHKIHQNKWYNLSIRIAHTEQYTRIRKCRPYHTTATAMEQWK